MRKPGLNQITATWRNMTPIQRRLVPAELASLDTQPVSAITATCPHGRAERVSRHVQANGLQRYRCQECGKTFSALAGAARQPGVERRAVTCPGIRVDGAWHVQKVNAYHSRLKGWAYRFRGVTSCCLGWFHALDREHGNGRKPAR
ncbi:MAG: IS1 family transposase [Anaerolinea sp.]|nr:IS1 family transposase [Anaerolinea sp.]